MKNIQLNFTVPSRRENKIQCTAVPSRPVVKSAPLKFTVPARHLFGRHFTVPSRLQFFFPAKQVKAAPSRPVSIIGHCDKPFKYMPKTMCFPLPKSTCPLPFPCSTISRAVQNSYTIYCMYVTKKTVHYRRRLLPLGRKKNSRFESKHNGVDGRSFCAGKRRSFAALPRFSTKSIWGVTSCLITIRTTLVNFCEELHENLYRHACFGSTYQVGLAIEMKIAINFRAIPCS